MSRDLLVLQVKLANLEEMEHLVSLDNRDHQEMQVLEYLETEVFQAFLEEKVVLVLLASLALAMRVSLVSKVCQVTLASMEFQDNLVFQGHEVKAVGRRGLMRPLSEREDKQYLALLLEKLEVQVSLDCQECQALRVSLVHLDQVDDQVLME